jgi:DNA-binding LytR/AlgR family response regulator
MNEQFYFHRKDGFLKKIKLDEVVFLEAADNYVKFHSPKILYMVRTSMDAALNQLPGNQFVQIHRSFAVSLDYLDVIGKDFVTFVTDPDTMLPVSKKYYAGLMEKIRIIEAGSQDATEQEE